MDIPGRAMNHFHIKHLHIDTLGEHVIFIHEGAVTTGNLGFRPLDRVHVVGEHPVTHSRHEVIGVLNFCGDALVAPNEIGLSEMTFHDLGLPGGTAVSATIALAPRSVDLVRNKLYGHRLDGDAYTSILTDVAAHRYSKVELSMFVLACALRPLDLDELVHFTRAMIASGTSIDFGVGRIVDKHCIGGIPGNRTTMVLVPILASFGLVVPKTSSRAITSPAGTADTMATLAEVAFQPDELRRVVERAGACIAWGGALALAPADDVLITVERPMEIDTEAQMIASILAKKKTVGATHVLIDIPVGNTAKVRSMDAADHLAHLFRIVAQAIDLHVEIAITAAHGPVGYGIGPRLEALDVLAVLHAEPDAPPDLREKSLQLAARLLELAGAVPPFGGYQAAQRALDSGAAAQTFDRIIDTQGRRELPPPAPYRHTVSAARAGRITEIDCWEIARVAKHAGAPANEAAGVRLLRTVGDHVQVGEPLFEIHAQSPDQLHFGRTYAESVPGLFTFDE